MIREIRHDGALIAIVIPGGHDAPGREFPTDPTLPMQLGYMKFDAGHRIEAHAHRELERNVRGTLEFILVRTGRVVADLYAPGGLRLDDLEMRAGDAVLLVSGGHGFTFLEPTALLEVKQGPYLFDQDKAPLRESGT